MCLDIGDAAMYTAVYRLLEGSEGTVRCFGREDSISIDGRQTALARVILNCFRPPSERKRR